MQIGYSPRVSPYLRDKTRRTPPSTEERNDETEDPEGAGSFEKFMQLARRQAAANDFLLHGSTSYQLAEQKPVNRFSARCAPCHKAYRERAQKSRALAISGVKSHKTDV